MLIHVFYRCVSLSSSPGRFFLKLVVAASALMTAACIKAQGSNDPIERPQGGARQGQAHPRGDGSSPKDEKAQDPGESQDIPRANENRKNKVSPPDGTKTLVDAIQKAHLYFNSGTDQARSRSSEVQVPVDKGPFRSITLKTRLSCPPPACDAWDRVGSFGIETPEGVRIELHRFITPYGVGVSMVSDVTHFAGLLREKTRFWVDIDTWSGPARDGGRYGAGWLFDAQLTLETGTPERQISQIIPLLSRQYITYGRPQEPAERRVTVKFPTQTLQGGSLEPQDSAKGLVQLFITGHGQGNSENCAEFCPKSHFFTLGDFPEYRTNIWRTNCAETVTDGRQRGTYQYSRAGWCPGASVVPWLTEIETLGEAFSGDGPTAAFRYWPQSYVNRADGGYNDQGHTLPQYLVSGVLFIFKP